MQIQQYSIHPFFFKYAKLYSTFYLGIGDHSIERFAIVVFFSGLSIWTQSSNILLNLKRVTALCSRFGLGSSVFEYIYFLHKIHQYTVQWQPYKMYRYTTWTWKRCSDVSPTWKQCFIHESRLITVQLDLSYKNAALMTRNVLNYEHWSDGKCVYRWNPYFYNIFFLL